MFDNLSYCIALKPIGFFVPSEEVDLQYVKCLATTIREVGKWTTPIPVEKHTGIIMDGNHRVRAAALLGLSYLPCVPLEYHDSRVSVTDWRTGMPFSIDSIRRRILSDRLLLPFKTTRHRFAPALPGTEIELRILTSTT